MLHIYFVNLRQVENVSFSHADEAKRDTDTVNLEFLKFYFVKEIRLKLIVIVEKLNVSGRFSYLRLAAACMGGNL